MTLEKWRAQVYDVSLKLQVYIKQNERVIHVINLRHQEPNSTKSYVAQ